jgi:hypothetical protein
MATKSPKRHKEPIMGLSLWPYRETGMSGFGHYPWWAFCIKNPLSGKKNEKMKKLSIVFLFFVFIFIPLIAKGADYNTQYVAVQAKIYPLNDQLKEVKASCPNSNLGATGEQGIICMKSFGQAAAIAEYISAIQNDLLTPVTDTSVVYENKLDDLHNQVFQVKIAYHQQIASISGNGGFEAQVEAEGQNALVAANAKIDALNQQIQATFQEYKLAVANQQNQQSQQEQVTCPANSHYVSNGQCTCDNGYVYISNACITYTQSCQIKYGANSYGDKNNCYCNSGYQWNSQQTGCISISGYTPVVPAKPTISNSPLQNCDQINQINGNGQKVYLQPDGSWSLNSGCTTSSTIVPTGNSGTQTTVTQKPQNAPTAVATPVSNVSEKTNTLSPTPVSVPAQKIQQVSTTQTNQAQNKTVENKKTEVTPVKSDSGFFNKIFGSIKSFFNNFFK